MSGCDMQTLFIYVPFPREYLALPLSLYACSPLSRPLPSSSISLLHFTLSTILNFKFAVGISTLTQLVLLIFDFILHFFFFFACCKNISNASHFVDHSNQTQALRLMLLQCTEVQWGRCRAGQGRDTWLIL